MKYLSCIENELNIQCGCILEIGE